MTPLVRTFLIATCLLLTVIVDAQDSIRLRNRDRKRDVELVTSAGSIRLRLHDATPLHRDNFLRLVKSRFYDSILFHRVIKGFMIQAGDPNTKRPQVEQQAGSPPSYTIPSEIRADLFHRKGALAAARLGDDVNPQRNSSATQFYIVHGRTWTDAEIDSVEVGRVKSKVPEAHRQVYKTTGGTAQLDNQYTVFGYVVRGQDVVDAIASTPVATTAGNRPVQDVRIIKARLVKRRN